MQRNGPIEKSQEARNNLAEYAMIGLITITLLFVIYRSIIGFISRISPKHRPTLQIKDRKSGTPQYNDIVAPPKSPTSSQSPRLTDHDQNMYGGFLETESKSKNPVKIKEKRPVAVNYNTQQVLAAINSKKDSKKSAKLEKAQQKEKGKESRANQQATTKSTVEAISTPKKKKSASKVASKTVTSVSAPLNTINLSAHINQIRELYRLHENEVQLEPSNIPSVMLALAFGNIPPTDYPDKKLCKDLLICARVGINIQQAVKSTCNDYFIDGLKRNDISTLLFACFLNDANSDKPGQIDPAIVLKLLKRADMLFDETVRSVGTENYSREQIFLSLFSDDSKKFSNKNLKESKFHRFLLDAATYYQFKLSETTRHYLEYFVSSNDQTTKSAPQIALYNYLVSKLSAQNVTVSLEMQTGVAAYSADILIMDNKTKRKIDVEFDGRNHFYKSSDGQTTTDQYKREHIARDKSLCRSGVEVVRFTSRDFSFDHNHTITSVSDKLNSFINEVKHNTTQLSMPPIMPRDQDTFSHDDTLIQFRNPI